MPPPNHGNAKLHAEPLDEDHSPAVWLITGNSSLADEVRAGITLALQIDSHSHAKNVPQWIKLHHANAVLIELRPDGLLQSDVETVRELRRLMPALVLLSLSESSARAMHKQAIEAGCDAHFTLPLDLSELDLVLRTATQNQMAEAEHNRLPPPMLGSNHFQDLIGGSDAMRRVYDGISQVADSRINVIVRGESGTGKELVARAIVALSSRRHQPFISLNCAALPENLIESELFGHERGAFTGAMDAKPGQIELADGGTLFLDEIATLTLPLQTKLLRVLEDRQVQRLGGRQSRKIDFRLVCATNEPLEEMTRTGKFRDDLYYRIHVVPIFLPALRERTGDIALLADYFLKKHAAANHLEPKRLTQEALSSLEEHSWPGNVRELENLMQRLIITVRGPDIRLEHLPAQVLAQSLAAQEAILLPEGGVRFDDEIRQLELALLQAAIKRTGGNKAAAARLLQLDTPRMKYLCRKYSV